MTRRRGRRRKKLLDDLKDRRGYCQLKEEAVDRTTGRNRFGRDFGPVVWQITDNNESFQPHYGPGVDSTSNRNKYQEYFLGGKSGLRVGLTTLPPSCAECLEIWEAQLPGTLRAVMGLLYFYTTILRALFHSTDRDIGVSGKSWRKYQVSSLTYSVISFTLIFF